MVLKTLFYFLKYGFGIGLNPPLVERDFVSVATKGRFSLNIILCKDTLNQLGVFVSGVKNTTYSRPHGQWKQTHIITLSVLVASNTD